LKNLTDKSSKPHNAAIFIKRFKSSSLDTDVHFLSRRNLGLVDSIDIERMEGSFSGNDVNVTFNCAWTFTRAVWHNDVPVQWEGVDGASTDVERVDINRGVAVNRLVEGDEGFGVEVLIDGDC
jgi:hypothetical protein